jgi:hypothetical protein
MIKWIKEQLSYRAKYLAAVEANREASQKTIVFWEQWEKYANHRAMREIGKLRMEIRENENIRKDMGHLQRTYNSLAAQWNDGISRYGVEMYGKWQPIGIAPKDKWILATEETGTRIDQVKWVEVPNGEGYNWVTLNDTWQPNDLVKYWMHLPEPPKYTTEEKTDG